MGYDISTRLADRDVASAFAKKYGYNYMFNKETGEYEGDATPYFRANIWGMGTIRRTLIGMYEASSHRSEANDEKLTAIINKFSWNDGEHVTPAECQFIIDLWSKDKAIDAIVMEVHNELKEDPNYLKTKKWDEEANTFVDYTATVDEVVQSKIALIEEFIDYLSIAKELDGCLVY